MELYKWGLLFFLSLLICRVEGYDEFEKGCVLAHNDLRETHGAQALVWSEELAADAQAWCDELALKDSLQHDNITMDTKNQGENLAAIVVTDTGEGPSPDACAMVVQEWYAEEQNYNYQTGMPSSPGAQIKHFAQVVWNSSYELGVGTARSTQHGDIICARYSPRGAIGGPDVFKQNILTKQADAVGKPCRNFANPIYLGEGKGFTLKTRPCVSTYNGGGGYGAGNGGRFSGSVSCGMSKSPRIVGGVDAKPSEFPWQVGFKLAGATWSTNIFCGGSLIDKKWVVSAAHCFQPPRLKDLKVVLGEFDVKNEEGNEVLIPVDKVINHEYYSKRTQENDIALVRLKNEVEFNDNMKPVCLPEGAVDFKTGKMCTVTGFGAIREGGAQTQFLQRVDVPLISNQQCSQSYGNISDKKVCAGYEEGKKDSCQGDSGGPLVCMENGKYYLKGVVSYGAGCARENYPGVYANVKTLLSWIEETKRANS